MSASNVSNTAVAYPTIPDVAEPPLPTLPDDLTDAEDFVVGDGTAVIPEADALPSTLEDDLAAQLFGEEDDDFAAGLFSDEEKFDDEIDKPAKQMSPEFLESVGENPTSDEKVAEQATEANAAASQPSGELDSSFMGSLFTPNVPAENDSGGVTMPAAVPAPPVSTGGREADYASRGDKFSRFTKDSEGNLVHKWKCDYATRGGGGRAQCRDLDCLERHEQGGVRTIDKGCLRIGRRVLMPGSHGQDPQMTFFWHHARCIFNTFLRSKKETRLIESEHDIEDFNLISMEDQALLRRIIAGAEDLRKARFAEGQGAHSTPAKRSLDGMEFTPVKRRKTTDTPELKVGNRVWTHCRVRAPAPPGGGPPVGDVAVKSAKPELAMIVEEPTSDGRLVVQFESQETEKSRLERHAQKKFKQIRGWLRYPRVFDGKKQRVSIDWIKADRPPPQMCGCCKQDWGHCSRSNRSTVWGVAVQ